jgi:LmbE family N-acetylglucosaminyl deacetylase
VGAVGKTLGVVVAHPDDDGYGVAAMVALHLPDRTQWNDMNNSESTEEQRLKSVSRETEVIAWPPDRPDRVLRDVFEGL